MYDKISKYLDDAFKDLPKTKIVIELKEEMLANSIERYDDLVREGFSEEDAFKEVKDSLGDLSNLLDELVESDENQVLLDNGNIVVNLNQREELTIIHKEEENSGQADEEPEKEYRNQHFYNTEINRIIVECRNENVQILPGSGTEVEVEEFGGKDQDDRIVIEHVGNELYLREPKLAIRNLLGLFDFHKKRLFIYVPSNFTGEIKVSNMSGDITVEGGLPDMDMQVSTFAGSVAVSNCRFGYLKAKASGGSVRLENISGNIDASSISGNIKAKNIQGNGSMSTTSGNVEVNNIEGGWNLKSISGDVVCEKFYGHGKFTGTSGDVELEILEMKGNITMESISGDIDCDIPSGCSFGYDAGTVGGKISIQAMGQDFGRRQKHMNGTIGANPKYQMKMKTVSGNVSVRER